jgi:hypothetical protein
MIGSHIRLTIMGKAPAILTQPSLHSGFMKHEGKRRKPAFDHTELLCM